MFFLYILFQTRSIASRVLRRSSFKKTSKTSKTSKSSNRSERVQRFNRIRRNRQNRRIRNVPVVPEVVNSDNESFTFYVRDDGTVIVGSEAYIASLVV